MDQETRRATTRPSVQLHCADSAKKREYQHSTRGHTAPDMVTEGLVFIHVYIDLGIGNLNDFGDLNLSLSTEIIARDSIYLLELYSTCSDHFK